MDELYRSHFYTLDGFIVVFSGPMLAKDIFGSDNRMTFVFKPS
jgi:hypothetical protein